MNLFGNRFGNRKNKNRGASLVAVLVVIAFVGTIGAVVASVTIANIQMKEVEQSGKKNFYSAEEVMDELTIGLNDIAARAMQSSYAEILSKYRDMMIAGEDIQAKFTKLYIYNLMNEFWDQDDATRKYRQITSEVSMPLTDPQSYIYVYGCYKLEKLKLPETEGCELKTTEADASFAADFEDGIFTLYNVKVTYKDALGYETTIKTDMVFHTPVLNFNFGGSNVVKDFMRCAVLADDQLQINQSGISINGNVYAGAGGIKTADKGGGTISGSKLVTRGDIIATSGSTLDIGKEDAEIWAENIGTEGTGEPAKLIMNGKIYVADDLNANAKVIKVNEDENEDEKKSEVILSGQYYGYNYLDDYVEAGSATAAENSSAMIINGKKSKVDLSGLNYLLLSGRTYISRGAENNDDIILGESVSVRTNQLAYYIPEQYVYVDEKNTVQFKKPSPDGSSDGLTAYAKSIGIDGETLMSYLKASKPIVPYYFQFNNAVSTRYYLNFENENSANLFFSNYYQANRFKVNDLAAQYADAIIIKLDDESLVYTLKGDVLYQSAEGEQLDLKEVTIEGDSAWDKNGAYWKLADRLATTYMSNKMYFEDMHTGISSESVRDEVDKEEGKTLFQNLINKNLIEEKLPQTNTNVPNVKDDKKEIPGSPTQPPQNQLIAVVNNSAENSPAYMIDRDYDCGIVIATGDVIVDDNFRGMIWAGGTIKFNRKDITITADEAYVSNLFAEDIARITNGSTDNSLFAKYFFEYDTLADSVIGEIQIDQYLTYQNWMKNEG